MVPVALHEELDKILQDTRSIELSVPETEPSAVIVVG